MIPYPLKLTTHFRTYYFGEHLISERLHKQGLPEGTLAESWEISDYRDARAEVRNGELAGTGFHDLVEQYPDEIVAPGWSGPHFPLLEKFLDASHMLPVHLHPDDDAAREVYSEPNGKTEAWHVLWAGEDASILAGVRDGLTRDELSAALREDRFDDVMPRFPVSTGDTVYVPAGVIHTFGPDTLIFEVQQTSDLGEFASATDVHGRRFSDEERDTNIRRTLDRLRTDYRPRPNPGLVLQDGPNRLVMGCAGPYFALERWTLHEPLEGPRRRHQMITLANVGDEVDISFVSGPAEGNDTLAPGESCILPAGLDEWRIVPRGEATLIACYLPDLRRDIVEPLRAAGHSDGEIRSLGETGI